MSAVKEAITRKRASPTAETRRKLSEGNRNRPRTREMGINISEAKMGVQQSPEARAKISEARSKSKSSDATKQAISESVRESHKLGVMGKEARFLTALATGQSVKTAAQSVGFDTNLAYKLAQNEQFRLAVLEATLHLRATLYTDMPDMLALAKQTLMDTMRSPTARNEVKVKAASHVISLAIFLASADKNFQPPAPTQEDLNLVEGELLP